MLKSVLKKIPVQTVSGTPEHHVLNTNNVKYVLTSEIRSVARVATLIVNFYNSKDIQENFQNGSVSPEYRLFIDETGDYITQHFKRINSEIELTWKKGTVCRTILPYWRAKVIVFDFDSEDTICSFFNYKEKNEKNDDNYLITLIQKRQEEKLEVLLKVRHKKETDLIDKAQENIPELPSDFENWVEEEALFESRYIYYTYLPNKKCLDGYCTHCKKEVKITEQKHNRNGICPSCNSSITYKAIKKSSTVHDRSNAAIIQKFGDGFILRKFNVSKKYSDFKKTELFIFEQERKMFKSNGAEIGAYHYGWFKQTEVRWCAGAKEYHGQKCRLYHSNIDEVLDETDFKYSALKTFATSESGIGFRVEKFLDCYERYPFIEYFIKMGLYKWTEDILDHGGGYRGERLLNLKGKKFHEIVKVDRNVLAEIIKMNLDLCCSEIFLVLKERGVRAKKEQIELIRNLPLEDVIRITNYVSFGKAVKYLESQQKISPRKTSLINILTDWRDYLLDCEKLGFNLSDEFIVLPRNLIERHNMTYRLVLEKESKNPNPKVDTVLKEAAKYAWETKKMMIVVPKNQYDIIAEGNALHHCVGNYVSRVVEGKTIILFLRKKDEPDMPFFTIEIRDNTIQQCRGYRNDDMPLVVKNVIEAYKKEVLSKFIDERRKTV